MFNWKIIKHHILPLNITKTESIDLTLIIIVIALFGIGGFLYLKQHNEKICRRFIQILSISIFGLLFIQCLCITKDTSLALKTIFNSNALSLLPLSWLPLVVIISVIFLGKNFYCYWICPLGFIQELTGSIKFFKNNGSGKNIQFHPVKIIILLSMLIANILVIYFKKPTPFIMAGGAWLSLILVVFLSLITTKLIQDSKLFAFKFGVFIIWFLVPIVFPFKLAGPWCVIGKANLGYSAITPFIVIGVSSMIVLRAWCTFVCPDGSFFQLLQFLRKMLKNWIKRQKKT